MQKDDEKKGGVAKVIADLWMRHPFSYLHIPSKRRNFVLAKNSERIPTGAKMSIPAVCLFGDLQEPASSSSFEAKISSFGRGQQEIYAVSLRIRCAELSFPKGYRLKIRLC